MMSGPGPMRLLLLLLLLAARPMVDAAACDDTATGNGTTADAATQPITVHIGYMSSYNHYPPELLERAEKMPHTVSSKSISDHQSNEYCFRLSNVLGYLTTGAMAYAVDELNSNAGWLNNVTFTYKRKNTCDDSLRAMSAAVDSWTQHGTRLFIGPETHCRSVAQFAASRNIPIISYHCSEPDLSDKREYPTFARTNPAGTKMVRALFALMWHFGWSKFTIVYTQDRKEFLNSIKNELDTQNEYIRREQEAGRAGSRFEIVNITAINDARSISTSSTRQLRQAVEETYKNTRVYVVFGARKLVYHWLRVMGELGVLDDGQYALVALCDNFDFDDPYSAMADEMFRDTKSSYDFTTPDAQRLVTWARSALFIVPTPIGMDDSAETNQFWTATTRLSGAASGSMKRVRKSRHACYLYDAVHLYAAALNDTVNELVAANVSQPILQALADGKRLMAKVFNRKYKSMQGFEMRIDGNGDAQGNFTLLTIQPVARGQWQTANGNFTYPLNMALNVTAVFAEHPTDEDDDDDDDDRFRRSSGRRRRPDEQQRIAPEPSLPLMQFISASTRINWLGAGAPLDEPVCGFDGARCRVSKTYAIETATSLLAVLLVVAAVVGVFIYRNRKFEKELSGLIWRIEPHDVDFEPWNGSSMDSVLSGSKASILLASQQVAPKTSVSAKKVSINTNPPIEMPDKLHQQQLAETCAVSMEPDDVGGNTHLLAYNNHGAVLGSPTDAGGAVVSSSQQQQQQQQTVKPSSNVDASSDKDTGMKGLALYRGTVVAVKQMRYCKKTRELSRACKIQMKHMRELHHDNVNTFLGIIVQSSSISVVREFCAKGSLFDVLRNDDIRIDQLFLASFVDDLLKGLIYIHESALKVHGNLKSTNTLITSRWTLQVADFGLHELRDGLDWENDEYHYDSLLWCAPEHLRSGAFEHAVAGSQKGDVFAFGIILHEMLTRLGPYQILDAQCTLTSQEIVRSVMFGCEGTLAPFRPQTDHLQCQRFILDLLADCWHEAADLRPDCRQFAYEKHLSRIETLRLAIGYIRFMADLLKEDNEQLRARKRNLMDHMMLMMERYQTDLESLVNERTSELKEEKRKTDWLLHRMLPKSVADQLLFGQDVAPEMYESVTIYFSDIVGFTSLSASSKPMEIVTFLNALYTLFDGIIRQYDVYKVETIGDAYMVVSGLPIRNGDAHAAEVACMALHLLDAVRSFVIPHAPDRKLLLRIGVHTGQCCAGVVGKTMPRYCLFGDTVNTASRMESNGEALKIHISESTNELLEQLGGYTTVDRGLITIKGKGELRTFWLTGKESGAFGTSDQLSAVATADDEALFSDVLQQGAGGKNQALRVRPSFKQIAARENRDSQSSLYKPDKLRRSQQSLAMAQFARPNRLSLIPPAKEAPYLDPRSISFGGVPMPITPGANKTNPSFLHEGQDSFELHMVRRAGGGSNATTAGATGAADAKAPGTGTTTGGPQHRHHRTVELPSIHETTSSSQSRLVTSASMRATVSTAVQSQCSAQPRQPLRQFARRHDTRYRSDGVAGTMLTTSVIDTDSCMSRGSGQSVRQRAAELQHQQRAISSGGGGNRRMSDLVQTVTNKLRKRSMSLPDATAAKLATQLSDNHSQMTSEQQTLCTVGTTRRCSEDAGIVADLPGLSRGVDASMQPSTSSFQSSNLIDRSASNVSRATTADETNSIVEWYQHDMARILRQLAQYTDKQQRVLDRIKSVSQQHQAGGNGDWGCGNGDGGQQQQQPQLNARARELATQLNASSSIRTANGRRRSLSLNSVEPMAALTPGQSDSEDTDHSSAASSVRTPPDVSCYSVRSPLLPSSSSSAASCASGGGRAAQRKHSARKRLMKQQRRQRKSAQPLQGDDLRQLSHLNRLADRNHNNVGVEPTTSGYNNNNNNSNSMNDNNSNNNNSNNSANNNNNNNHNAQPQQTAAVELAECFSDMQREIEREIQLMLHRTTTANQPSPPLQNGHVSTGGGSAAAAAAADSNSNGGGSGSGSQSRLVGGAQKAIVRRRSSMTGHAITNGAAGSNASLCGSPRLTLSPANLEPSSDSTGPPPPPPPMLLPPPPDSGGLHNNKKPRRRDTTALT